MPKNTVLVIDDNADNIDLLSNILKNDYRVKAATNGRQGIDIANIIPQPDIILLDIMMPEMDGFEVIQELKKSPSTAKIPVIFVSAKNEINDEKLGFDLGAVDYISKPVSVPIVKARVATHIALHSREQILQQMVKDEVEKRVEKERLLIRQSRLAAMGEMMRAITHQWNQPLAVLASVAANLRVSLALEEKIEPEELDNSLSTIDKSIDFMSQTMLDFKNYFSPDKTKRAFDIEDEISAILEMLQPILKINNIQTNVTCEENLIISGVPSEFKQVLLNLIGNAKDAIIDKKNMDGKIDITASKSRENILLSITDNGGGIPKEIVDKVFDDYFTTKEEHGTGIGLAMSKMIVETQFNGSIDVINVDGGAKFQIIVPVYK